MARLNITIPDGLYARLEQLRDRINLSKVCATALEKEVTMLEGQPAITDPRIAQLLQRLQSTRERWHQRGYEDGIEWAVEHATRDELQSVATHLAEQDGQQLAVIFQIRGKFGVTTHFEPSAPPHVVHLRSAMPAEPGVAGAIFHASKPMPAGPGNVAFHQIPFPGFPTSFRPAERLQYWQDQDRERSGLHHQGEAKRAEVDETAYLEGWRDAVKGIWQTIAPALS